MRRDYLIDAARIARYNQGVPCPSATTRTKKTQPEHMTRSHRTRSNRSINPHKGSATKTARKHVVERNTCPVPRGT